MSNGNSKRKKYVGYLLYLVPLAIILLSYVAIVAATNEPEPFTIVSGKSMQPTILAGSIAVITKTPFRDLKAGDIIVFRPVSASAKCQSNAPPSLSEDAEHPCFVVHRIVSITDVNGQRLVQTEGDANEISLCPPSYPTTIDCDINQTSYVGQVVLQFPLAGWATQYPYNFYIAALILLALVVELYVDAVQARKPSLGSRVNNPGAPGTIQAGKAEKRGVLSTLFPNFFASNSD